MEDATKKLYKLMKSRKNQKIIYKIPNINYKSRFVNSNVKE